MSLKWLKSLKTDEAESIAGLRAQMSSALSLVTTFTLLLLWVAVRRIKTKRVSCKLYIALTANLRLI